MFRPLTTSLTHAYLNDVMEQLEGQIASAKVAMARLSSPELYYVLSGNDFNLDINDPDAPKVVCMGNNPQKKTDIRRGAFNVCNSTGKA